MPNDCQLEISSLKTERGELLAEIDELENKLKEAEDDYSKLDAKCDALQLKISELEDKIIDKNALLATLKNFAYKMIKKGAVDFDSDALPMNVRVAILAEKGDKLSCSEIDYLFYELNL